MRTRIYIDGYNLYYGVVKNTKYKWLDPIQLVKNAVAESAPSDILTQLSSVYSTKYFTSRVIPKISFSDSAERDQSVYLNALMSQYTDAQLSIILGYHSVKQVKQRKLDPNNPKELHAGCEQVDVWRIEEKQTDINIAVQSLLDAHENTDPQQFVIVSNDTDLCPLLDALAGMAHISVGVIAPVDGVFRQPATDLEKRADWFKKRISHDDMARAQMPHLLQQSVRDSVKSGIRKPLEWYGQPELALEVFDQLFRALGKRNKCFKWLEQLPIETGIPGLPDLPKPAISMLDDVDDAELVKRHVIAFTDHLKK